MSDEFQRADRLTQRVIARLRVIREAHKDAGRIAAPGKVREGRSRGAIDAGATGAAFASSEVRESE